MDTKFDFDAYLEKHGADAFDQYAKKLADELNAARQRYDDNQKKKAEAEAKKKAEEDQKKKKRAVAVNNVRDALLAYYGKRMTDRMATTISEAILEATDELLELKPKVEVLKDEDTPDGHVFAARIHDCGDLYDKDMWDKLFSDWL